MEPNYEPNYDECYLEKDISQYAGDWIAICEGKIIAHGADPKAVFSEAREQCPGKKVLFSFRPGIPRG